jgi:ParB-like chromosome segregation protein Spo0J
VNRRTTNCPDHPRWIHWVNEVGETSQRPCPECGRQFDESMIEVIWDGADELRPTIVPIDELTPHEKNPKRESVEELMASLKRWGQVRAVLTDPNGRIVAGHHVTEAASRLGWTHVAAIPHAFETDQEALAYLVADNELAARGSEDRGQQFLDLARELEDRTGTGIDEDDVADLDLEGVGAVIRRRTRYVPYHELKPHPQNYREHDQQQIEHLVRSLEENGFYRNLVCAKDGTILAGHGMWIAARRKGVRKVPVTFLDCGPDDPVAKKVLVADNELGRRAEGDDRALSEMLRELREGDADALVGTGYDSAMLANLILVTRPKSEIADHDHAAEWVGLPEYEPSGPRVQLLLSFETEEERQKLCERLEITNTYRRGQMWSSWWPPRERQDLANLYFDFGDGA